MLTLLKPELPEGTKCAVSLTFDFDVLSPWVGPFNKTTPTAISRGEFGLIGTQRILDLLDKYSIKGTWFIPGYDVDTFPDVVKEISNRGHEIGHHGYIHEMPLELKPEDEENILEKGMESIKRVTGSYPQGYRSPAWDLSDSSVNLLLKHNFLYDSSLMGHDYVPYKVRQGDIPAKDGPYKFGADSDLIELPVYWGLDDYPHFEYLGGGSGGGLQGLRAGSAVLENWTGDFDYMFRNVPGGVYSICCHPFVTGRGHRMNVLEGLIKHIKQKKGVSFLPMLSVAQLCSK